MCPSFDDAVREFDRHKKKAFASEDEHKEHKIRARKLGECCRQLEELGCMISSRYSEDLNYRLPIIQIHTTDDECFKRSIQSLGAKANGLRFEQVRKTFFLRQLGELD